jgi:hypothetical protein
LILVLADGPDGDAQTVIEVRVQKRDVGAVCFAGEGVVAVIDCQVAEEEVG